MAQAQCPNCGSPVSFAIGASISLVCANCKSVVVRTDRGLQNLGRVADVVSSDSTFSVGDKGQLRGRSFSVLGRLVLQHPMGGTWEEYYVSFADGKTGWLSEAQGRWSCVSTEAVSVPPYAALRPMMEVPFGAFGMYVVAEVGRGRFFSAEGELPFGAVPGTERFFADFYGPAGYVASVDYGQGSEAPQVNMGISVSFSEFQIQRMGMREETVKTESIKCPNCGAPIPIVSAGKAERVACMFCGALSDVALNTTLLKQDLSRSQPFLPLGAKGTLEGVSWIIAGMMERSTNIEGEDFSWQEFLLYNAGEGFAWLVVDEGIFRFGRFVSPTEVSVNALVVKYKEKSYLRRNQGSARVRFVLGEFYWKVEVGEEVETSDYVSGTEMVSSETSGSEVNWTYSKVVPSKVIAREFGVDANLFPRETASTEGGKLNLVWVIVIIIFVVLLLIFVSGDCGSGGGGGGVGAFGVGSGFGGK